MSGCSSRRPSVASALQRVGRQEATDDAKRVGQLVAERAKQAGVDKVVFDRAGFKYHGRVRSLAEAAREAGLDF